jgi:ATP-dependent helicase/nuclease subunit A
VFIVGDPKQSIYRFRGAEPRVFAAARDFVRDALDGHLLECDHTRRNAPEVLAVLNQAFDAAQRQGEFDGFRAHTTDAATTGAAGALALARVERPERARAVEADPVWRDSLTTPRHEPEEILREQEAERVAGALRALLDAGAVEPGELLVLCRKRESLRLVAAALQAQHVPCVPAEDMALNEAAEALDLVAVLDALVSPRHRLSLARALRSPLFGASDADLVALAQAAGDTRDWWAALHAPGQPSAALARAGELLRRWQPLVRQLPPHDLLERIVAEGELRLRVAACVPPERRAQAFDAIDAVLAQALGLDAGRYATPYGFVRAMKRGAVRVTPPSHPDAVQLLTVHGAKGLEADVVAVVDSDPEPRNAETATLLVDWPVELPWPRCCAFVYAESACPASLQPLLDAENRARRREELNGLYVAMTRARRQLVFSATAPSRPAPDGPSWWAQLEPFVRPWVVPAAMSSRGARPLRAPAPLKILPGPVLPTTVSPTRASTAPAADTPATRLGKAVHRTLEWVTAGSADVPIATLAAGAAAEFGAPAAEVGKVAGRILAHPDSARFFADPALAWAGNEVALMLDGEPQRLDRLVQLADGTWWVLDYKLQHRPQDLPAYHQQLRRYREAVRRAQPGAAVRCAFISGEGAVIEVGEVG